MMVLLKRYWLQLTSDRRKFSMLCAMVAVALLLWARLIVISNVPRTAVAEPETSASAVESAPEPARSDKRKVAPVPIALDVQPARDPFVINEAHFPNPAPVPDLPAEAAKSAGQKAEDPEQVEARLRERLRTLIEQLSLDAVMSSASLAVINGEMCRLGGQVAADSDEGVSFTLVEVSRRSVLLEFEGRRFELKMDAPGG